MKAKAVLTVLPLAMAALVGSVQAASDVTPLSAIVAPAGIGSWTFLSGGWGGGGVVTGTFSGSDIDADGQLSSFAGEVTGFSMSYSGGTIVAPFGLGFADLFGLVYDLNGGPLGDGTTLAVEGVGAAGGSASFVLGPGPLALCDTGVVCGIIDGPAAVVSEPASWALMIAGCGLLGQFARRRKLRSADQAA
jgi:hypothetical protein